MIDVPKHVRTWYFFSCLVQEVIAADIFPVGDNNVFYRYREHSDKVVGTEKVLVPYRHYQAADLAQVFDIDGRDIDRKSFTT